MKLMIKKFLISMLAILSLFLVSCGDKQNSLSKKINWEIQNQVVLNSIYTWIAHWIFVWVSDPHRYSKKGPLLISWSYYFDPFNFYKFAWDLNLFLKAYSSWFDWRQVFYYDDKDWLNAAIVVYVLRNFFWKKNVSLRISPKVRLSLKYWLPIIPVKNVLSSKSKMFSWWAFGTGKFWIVYDPKKVNFKSGDLLLYVCDGWTMKSDIFYKNFTWNVANFYLSHLINIDWSLKSKKEVYKMLKKKWINFHNYDRVYLYYPKYWRKSGIVALYFNNF